MRAGKAQIAEAYVYLKNGEAFLFGAHISPLNSASTHVDTDPTRTRKLLLNRRQLDHLVGAVERRGYTLVPLQLYWKDGPRQARDRPRQGQEAARQARHRQGPRLAARQEPDHEGQSALSCGRGAGRALPAPTYSGRVCPEPPISAGMSLNFGLPSLIGSTLS